MVQKCGVLPIEYTARVESARIHHTAPKFQKLVRKFFDSARMPSAVILHSAAHSTAQQTRSRQIVRGPRPLPPQKFIYPTQPLNNTPNQHINQGFGFVLLALSVSIVTNTNAVTGHHRHRQHHCHRHRHLHLPAHHRHGEPSDHHYHRWHYYHHDDEQCSVMPYSHAR